MVAVCVLLSFQNAAHTTWVSGKWLFPPAFASSKFFQKFKVSQSLASAEFGLKKWQQQQKTLKGARKPKGH
jgi:hypothetical protein